MKRIILTLVALVTLTVQASAMSYEQAREQALFLTDKMAYELNLNDEQYEAAYEINLDYLMGVSDYRDLYGSYWNQRNLDLSYILLDWQYRAYLNAAYFYRPLYWDAGYYHFAVYARYPHRDYFFFGRPHFYVSYRGGHSWHYNGGRSWYHGRNYSYRSNGRSWSGMRDGFNRGDFGRGSRFDTDSHRSTANRTFGNGNRTEVNRTRSFGGTPTTTRVFGGGSSNEAQARVFGNARQSSTRTTVTRPSTRSFGGNTTTEPSRTFTPSTRTRSFGGSSSAPSTRSFGGGGSAPTRSFGGGSPAPSTRSFGGGGSASARSFGGGSSAPSRSFGGGGSTTARSFGGSTGGHFGRGR